MKILIIGGGRQLGTYLIKNIEKLKNYELTIFNRAINKTNFLPHKLIEGDRNQDLKNLDNNFYDCIIDTCAYNYLEDFRAFNYFSKYTLKYILISSSYVDIINKNIDIVGNVSLNEAKIIKNYAFNKNNLENKLKDYFNDYLIARSVPLISSIDHTGRTLNLIKFLMQYKKINEVPNLSIQVESANNFAKRIIESINISDKIIENAGATIKLKKIYEYLKFNNKNFYEKHIKKNPYANFTKFFSGIPTEEKEILKVLRDVYINFF